jgi:hypothetical protein
MKDTGGRAFPHSYEVMPDIETHIHHGMTLRDYFAAKAMQGFIACPNTRGEPNDIAEWCYTMADAMLAERSKE